MNMPPIRNDTGNIGCPKCSSALKKEKSSFKIHGEFIGNFESYVCSICNYSALTENGYDKALLQAKQLAINPVSDIPEIHKIEFRIHYSVAGINDQNLKDEVEKRYENNFTDINGPLLVTSFTKKSKTR